MLSSVDKCVSVAVQKKKKRLDERWVAERRLNGGCVAAENELSAYRSSRLDANHAQSQLPPVASEKSTPLLTIGSHCTKKDMDKSQAPPRLGAPIPSFYTFDHNGQDLTICL